MDKVLDELGLVLENGFLVVYIPARNSALVWRVKARANRGYEVFDYGPLPLKAGDALSSYDAGTVLVPADGVMPGRSYTSTGISFPLARAVDERDMWYLPEDYRDRAFHVIQYVTPSFLRMDLQIPVGVSQNRFQRDRLVVGLDAPLGFRRGRLETVHLHRLHYGYRYGNDTNLSVRTSVRFVYGEYLIETPRDPQLIFDVLTRRVQSHWISLPITTVDATIAEAMSLAYGFHGFPLYGIHQRDRAIKEYEALLREVRA